MNGGAETGVRTCGGLIERGALRGIWQAAHADDLPVLVPSVSDREGWKSIAPEARDLILAAADAESGTPWILPRLSQWSAFGRTGDRRAYEDVDFAHKRRIRIAVLAAGIDPTSARVFEAADGLWTLCEQSTWCWSAHDDSFSRGLMATDIARPYLDLGAGEAAALAGWAALVLGDALETDVPGLIPRLRSEVERRILSPLMDRHDWWWENREINNWLAWIVGNVIPAALVFTDGERRRQVLDRCVDGVDRYLAQLPADGGIDEGFAYWWQGAGRAFDALALLDAVSVGAIGAAIAEGALGGLRELARFPERMLLGDDWVASYSDAEARIGADAPWHSLFRAARLCGLDDTAAFAAGRRREGTILGLEADTIGGIGRMVAESFDARWRATAPRRAPFPAQVEFASIAVGIRREHAGDSGGLAVIAKAGHNAESHNHNDLGSVAVAVDGVPLLADLGRGVYTATTFSDQRYSLWYLGSAWHSLPHPHGLEQQPGRQWEAPMRSLDDGWSIDLSAAYAWPVGADRQWTREIRLRDGELVVRDEGAAVGAEGTRISVVCAGVPERIGEGVLVPGRHGSRSLLLAHDAADVEVKTRAAGDPHLERSWGAEVSRILFAPRSGARSWELRARARA
ncbi:hypothetical protein QFZ53_003759 [Microbacterium natoriense]|uniref:Heparinase n=1 Tax=Microbacterium natoriense TaxID=284570 RepID=A0AAW8F1Y6_9MICO|nr:heparinase II/III family protein [Microbacterium natoriense]MDQ0649563.1 hypothetical protein [Microbacterium natoriense]